MRMPITMWEVMAALPQLQIQAVALLSLKSILDREPMACVTTDEEREEATATAGRTLRVLHYLKNTGVHSQSPNQC